MPVAIDITTQTTCPPVLLPPSQQMYRNIDSRPPARVVYARHLLQGGYMSKAAIEADERLFRGRLDEGERESN